MGDTKERLGIEIDVTFGKDLQTKLNELVNTLNQAFKVEGLQKMYDQFSKLEGAAGKATAGFKASEKDIENFAKATGLHISKVKEYLESMSSGKAVDKFVGDLRKTESAMDAHVNTFKAQEAAKVKAQEVAGQQILAIQRNTDAANKAEVQGYVEKGQQILAIERRNQQAARETLNAQIAAGQANMASYRNSGYQPVNGGYVKSSVDINKSLMEAQAEANKLNAAFNKIGAIDPFKNIFKGMAVANTTAGELQAKLVAVYGDLSKLDGKSLANVRSQLNQYNKELKNSEVVAKQSAGAFEFLGSTLGKMATRLTEFYGIRAVLFAVSNQVREATTSLIDLGQATRDIAAISGAPLESAQAMSDAIMDIAKASRFTTKEVSEMVKVLAQAGVKEKDLPSVTKSVGLFANATGSDPSVAADLTTTSMNVFNMKADDTVRIVNTLTAALNESKLGTEGLATAFNYLAPQASQLGMSLEQTSGFIATMAQAGIKPSTIGTGGSQLLKELSAPKGRLQALLTEKGISNDDVSPRLRTFDQIADKFAEKAISAERLFQTLDTRVARSLVTALTLGGDSFRLMTDNITGTSAALVANTKAMDGPRAKINVLKQEFVDLIKSISEGGFGKVLGGIVAGLTALMQGLNTTQGAMFGWGTAVTAAAGLAVVAFGSIKTALIALNLAFMTSPLGWFAAVVAGLGLATAAWGYYSTSEKRAAEASNKAMSEKLSVMDQYQKLVNKARIEAEANNKEIKEAGNLYTKEGKAAFERNKIFSKSVTVSSEIREEMRKLKEAYPEHLANMNTELGLVQDLYNTKSKFAKFDTTMRAAEDYNNTVKQLNFEKSLYSDAVIKTKGKTAPVGLGAREDFERAQATVKNFPDKEKYYNEILAAKRNGMPFTNLANGYVMAQPSVDWIAGAGAEVPKKATDTVSTGAGAGAKHTPIDLAALVTGYTNTVNKEVGNNVTKDIENKIKADIDTLKNTKDAGEYKTLSAKIKTDYDIYKARIVKEYTEDQWTAVASSMGATYKDGTFIWPKTKEGDTDKAAYVKYGKDKDVVFGDLVKQAVDAKLTATNSGIDLKKLQLPKLKTVPEKDTTTYREKQEGMRISDEVAALSLRKETARTAAEVREIDDQVTAAQADSATRLRKIYEEQVALIERKGKSAYSNEEEYQTAHQGSIDRVTELTRKENELTAAMERQKKATIWDSFTQGFNKAAIALGDLKSNMESLGNTIGTTMFSGVQDTLNSTLNIWTKPDSEAVKSLRDDIAKLKAQKAEIEGNIAAAGTAVTPEQATALSNQKVQLAGINTELAKQSQLLSQQTNAWTAFKNGLSKLISQIADEIQRYIVQLMVVYTWQKLAGFPMPGSAGMPNTQTMPNGSTTTTDFFEAKVVATGGLLTEKGVQRFAAGGSVLNALGGGQVPLNMGVRGKDSVPTITMPGEYVIQESAVNHYGVDFFRNVNAKRFADGGLVGASDNYSKGTGKSTGNSEANLTIINVVDPSSIPKTTGQEILNVISYEAAQRGPTFRHLKASLQG